MILQICGTCHDDANDPGFEFEVLDKIDATRHGTIEAGTGAARTPRRPPSARRAGDRASRDSATHDARRASQRTPAVHPGAEARGPRAERASCGALAAAARGWLEELHEEGVEASSGRDALGASAPARASRVRRARAGGARPGAARRSPSSWRPPTRAPPGERPTLEAVRERARRVHALPALAGRAARSSSATAIPNADLMFVGEGPGAEEDKRGLPFVGRAGELLTRMIEKGLGHPAQRGLHLQHREVPAAARTARRCRTRPPPAGPFLDGQIAAVRAAR